jgi:CubicO group peptidase (beta-lactamase class C family)
VSKRIVSAAALKLIEMGVLRLDDPVTRWLPEFRPRLPDGRQPAITIRQLLTHTSGLGYSFFEPAGGPYHTAGVSDGIDQPGLSFADNARRLASVPLLSEPGAAFHYSLSTDVLGEAIARAGRGTLPEVVERLVTGPLAMRDTGFSARDRSRVAVAYAPGVPRPERMIDGCLVPFGESGIRFAPSRAFDPSSYASGGAGMVGTASDFLVFLEMLRTGRAPILERASAGNDVKPDRQPHRSRALRRQRRCRLRIRRRGSEGPRPRANFSLARQLPLGRRLRPLLVRRSFRAPHGGFMTNTAIEGMAGKLSSDIESAVYGR